MTYQTISLLDCDFADASGNITRARAMKLRTGGWYNLKLVLSW